MRSVEAISSNGAFHPAPWYDVECTKKTSAPVEASGRGSGGAGRSGTAATGSDVSSSGGSSDASTEGVPGRQSHASLEP